jgi:type I restriction enzyme S subunit
MKRWKIVPLGEVCDIIGGGTPSKKNEEFYTGKIYWATVRDMKEDIISETECKITEEAVKKSATNIIKKGNVVIATRVGLGKICLVAQDTAINQDLRGIVPKNSDQLLIRFLFWWFKSISKIIIDAGTGATVQGVKVTFVKALKIPLPPLEEQKQIVTILDEAFEGIDKAIENTEKNLANAREIFESYLNSIFINKGDDWVEKKLGDVCEFKNGINFDKTQKGNQGILTVDVLNMYSENNYLSLDSLYRVDKEIKKDYLLKKGDLLFVRSSVKREGVGWAAYFPDFFESVTFCGFIIRARIIEKFIIDPDFLVYYFRSKRSREEIIAKAKQATITNINQGLLSELLITYPVHKKQIQIITTINELKEETQRLETIYKRKIEALKELKQSILQKAFTGELTNPTIKEEAA